MESSKFNGDIVNTKRKKTKLEIVMYILAIVTAVIACFLVYSSIAYIVSYYSSYGMSFASGWKNAIQYIVSNSGAWLVYAVIFFGIARITARLENIKPYPKKEKVAKIEIPTSAPAKESDTEVE